MIQEYEFDCKCGCGLNNVDRKFLELLRQARKIADIPFVITSGCRCVRHNKIVGGSDTSSHLICCAADIIANTSRSRFIIEDALKAVGFNRFGYAKSFIHVDNDKNKEGKVIWLY